MTFADIAVLAAIVAVPVAVRLLSRRRTGGRRCEGNCTCCNGCNGCSGSTRNAKNNV